ncbi:serine hydrolase domain-containing protein [Corallococcus interemptor]|uniref:serine hydrolase domain-containing protein n=1 Tax=Corallococcus interemptor TaxID=2316720 RepID=UPI003D014276
MHTSLRFTMVGLVGLMTALPARAAPPPAVRIQPARIDAVFKDYSGPSTPGCALGIYQDGRILYSKGYGVADLNQGTPITATTLFDIGSVSKQFTAASVVLLAQEGKLALTDDIRKYLPELPDYGTPITVDHLLHHTSGLRDYTDLLYLQGHYYEDVTDDDEALAVIARQRALRFKPGTRFEYSNSGYFLASLIVKRVTGKSLTGFAKERLFQPLGMTRSHFREDHTAVVPGRATAYAPAGNKEYRLDMSNWNQLGDGQVQTSVTELVKWEENFSTAKVGGRALIDGLLERGTLSSGDRTGYGRGLFLDTYRGAQRVQHSGSWGGYRAMLMRFPVQHVSIAVLCNRADTRPDLADRVADLVLGKAFQATEPETKAAATRAPEPASGDFARYVGTYYDDAAHRVLNVRVQDGKLELAMPGRALPLRAAGGDRFEVEGAPLAVAFAGEQMTLLRGQEIRTSFQRVPPATPLSDDAWKQLVGTYFSPELEATWRIELKDGKAVLKGRALGTNPLVESFVDAFNTPHGLLRLTRDGTRQVTGFVFGDVRFERK